MLGIGFRSEVCLQQGGSPRRSRCQGYVCFIWRREEFASYGKVCNCCDTRISVTFARRSELSLPETGACATAGLACALVLQLDGATTLLAKHCIASANAAILASNPGLSSQPSQILVFPVFLFSASSGVCNAPDSTLRSALGPGTRDGNLRLGSAWIIILTMALFTSSP